MTEETAVQVELRSSHRKGLEKRGRKEDLGRERNGSRLPLPFMIIG